MHDFRTSGLHDFTTSRLHDFMNSRLHDFTTSGLHDFRTSRLQDFTLHDFTTSRVQDLRTSHITTSRLHDFRTSTPRTCGAFYKATVMAVLLFGSETWNLAPSSLKRLEGFHIRAAWHMAGTGPRQNPDGSWTYPDTDAVMETVGLRSISHLS